MTERRSYHPENWKPLERWLPASVCRQQFNWMWRDEYLECYRFRASGELLYLDQLGQCLDVTEVGPMPADFQQQFERCTGGSYESQGDLLSQADAEEDEDEDSFGTPPPDGNSLSCIVTEWADECKIDPSKRDALLSELSVFRAIFISEQEMQCKKQLNTTLCWLR
ncbi:MAG: hypothetical protein M3Y27_31265 [Acidobacteriota bacterium]|nr:hypothetical protein [Acidobacteriota bacterium]